MNDWMKNLPDDLLISEINLAGTHNSPTKNIHFSHFSKCQKLNIHNQLNIGVRLLDLRLKFDGQNLFLSHAIFKCKKNNAKSQDLLFSDIYHTCKTFLTDNPTETVLMSIKREAKKSSEETFDFLYDGFLKNNPLFYTENRVPTLSEVRGKIVLLNRCGADIENEAYTDLNCGINLTGWIHQGKKNHETCEIQKAFIPKRTGKSDEYFYLQDYYALKPDDRWEKAILPVLEAPPTEKAILFNFFSGSCIFNRPKKYSKKIAKLFKEYELKQMKKYGWIVLDFADKKTVRKIVVSNF